MSVNAGDVVMTPVKAATTSMRSVVAASRRGQATHVSGVDRPAWRWGQTRESPPRGPIFRVRDQLGRDALVAGFRAGGFDTLPYKTTVARSGWPSGRTPRHPPISALRATVPTGHPEVPPS